MSHMHTQLDQRRLADLKRDPHHVAEAIANYEAARAAHPRFAATSCSQCGKDTGPGSSGFSHCADHRRDVANRPGFDPDYGSYTAHPMDPRTPEPDDDALTADDARSEATDQVLSYAEGVADWLAKACDCDAGRQPLDVRALDAVQIMEGPPHLLLTVLMNGDNTQALRALHRMRDLAAKHFAPEIDSRAAQLLAGQ